MTRARDTDLDREVDEPWSSFGGIRPWSSAATRWARLREPPNLMNGRRRMRSAKVSAASAGAVAT
jgi:hypothetical protein